VRLGLLWGISCRCRDRPFGAGSVANQEEDKVMRSLCMALVGALAGLVLAPSLATADEVQDQLLLMQERITQLEDRLQATSDELTAANQRAEAQHKLIERAGLSDDRAAASGVAAFLETLGIGGWVSASYNYNLDDPDGRDLGAFNAGAAAPFSAYPFHADPNSFQLDQFWLELERPVSEEHRAGFRADLVYGKTAELLNVHPFLLFAESPDGVSGSDEDFELFQAYLQYLAPIGEGVNFQLGKFATPIGAEVVQSPYNFNITRGHVWNLFQPITHVGVMASTDWGEGFTTSLGVVNDDKAVLWSLGWSEDTVAVSFNGAYGSSDSAQNTLSPIPGAPDMHAGDKETILDLILRWNPSDDFSAYVNADYIDSENSEPLDDTVLTGEFDGYGVAAAGRLALSERLGVALRAEWANLDFDGAGAASDQELEVWGLTGTVDYDLTNRLRLRGELRYDNVRSSDALFQNLFLDSPLATPPVGSEDDQVVGLIEAIYSFNGF
jgi:hypothetical protein